MALSAALSENPVSRIDSSYFLRRDLELVSEGKAGRHDVLGDIAYVTDGIHTSIPFRDGSGIKVMSAKHPKEGYIDDGFFEEIDEFAHASNPRTSLCEGDVLLSTVGTIGNAAVVTSELLPANSDRHVAILRPLDNVIKPIESEFLATTLLSTFGRMQTRRETTGNVQPNLFLDKIRALIIPRFHDDFEAAVAEYYRLSHNTRTRAKVHLVEAQNALLGALGLSAWSPPEPLTYTRSATSVAAAGRLDANYFAPKYDDMLARLNATGEANCLGDGLTTVIARGSQPIYADEGLPVINSKHVRTNRVLLSDSNRRALPKALRIRSGDVLVNGTGVGTIGRAAPYLAANEALPDNHVTIVRPRAMDPLFLSVFLNTALGQMQIERMISGSSGQIELYPDDIRKIVVWCAPASVQESVASHIRGAFAHEARSIVLLSTAKRAVEIAIEQGEVAALAYIAEQPEAVDAATV